MVDMHRPRVKYVIGPDGSPLTIADLPPPSTKRWVIRRKAEVVAAVRGGLLSLEEACSRYTLTVDEFPVAQRSFPIVFSSVGRRRPAVGGLLIARPVPTIHRLSSPLRDCHERRDP